MHVLPTYRTYHRPIVIECDSKLQDHNNDDDVFNMRFEITTINENRASLDMPRKDELRTNLSNMELHINTWNACLLNKRIGACMADLFKAIKELDQKVVNNEVVNIEYNLDILLCE